MTGAAGFIGSHLVEHLLADGFTVSGIDDLSSGTRENLPANFDLRVMDIRDPMVQNVVAELRPDFVFHLAAQISVSVSARKPQLDADINVGGSVNLLEGIRNLSDKSVKFVYVTSGGTAYGEAEILPATESTPIRPLSPYGASKYAVEVYLPVYKNMCGIDYSIVRLANVYGPRQDPHGEAGVVAIFARGMLSGSSPQVFGDGNDERDYVYVTDVVNAIILASDCGSAGPFNVGTGIGTSTNEIFRIVAKYCGYEAEAVRRPVRVGDVNRIYLDPTYIFENLGWSPSLSLDDGVRTTVNWFKDSTH